MQDQRGKKKRWQDEYRQKDREVKRQVRVDKRKWTEEIVEEAENAAKQQHTKTPLYPDKSIKQRKAKAECCSNGQKR